MEPQEISRVLDEMALLSELTGENPFKSRAYSKAARIVEEYQGEIKELSDKGDLTSIDGIGDKIAVKIADFLADRKVDEYERLKKEVPAGVREMLAIPGLGPKKVRYIWKECTITSVGSLEMSCGRHLIAALPGFGKKTEEKILAGIASLKKYAGKRLLAEVLPDAFTIAGEMQKLGFVNKVEIAGSLRRRKEIVKDADILVATNKPDDVMEKFIALPDVERVVERGKTKSAVILHSGAQCDLRAVTPDEFPFALHHFTGSKEHNVKMRKLAKSKNLKMNEYGIFEVDSQTSLICKNEAEIYRKMGMDYIEPELREDMGEIEAAMEGGLPKLVDMDDIKGVFHVHTDYSDGSASIEEMARYAKKRNYKYIQIADHSQSLKIAGGLLPEEVLKQHDEIDRINKKMKGFRILKGIEVDILGDGTLDFDDDMLSRFDLVVASVHTKFGMPKDEMTKRLVGAVSNPHVDILGHPSGRLLLAREAYAMDMREVIEAAAAHDTAIEINAHPQRLDLDWRWLKFAKEKGVGIAIGPDAHSPEGIDNMIFGVWAARKGWLEKGDVLNCLDSDEVCG